MKISIELQLNDNVAVCTGGWWILRGSNAVPLHSKGVVWASDSVLALKLTLEVLSGKLFLKAKETKKRASGVSKVLHT